METNLKRKTVQSILFDMDKGKISLTHRLQRPEGQWDKKRKTDLIDSLLRKIPLNPTYGCKDDKILGIIDGVQRFSTIRDFIDYKFAYGEIPDDYPLFINGEKKDISGLKFKKLDDDVKQELLNAELQYYEITDYTDKDIRILFERLNAGKPLNSRQMRIIYESEIVNNEINELIAHPFMIKLISKTQRKNCADRDAIIESIMLATGHTSFIKKDIDRFTATELDNYINMFDDIRKALDVLDERIENIKLPITSAAFLIYAATKVVSENKNVDKLIDDIVEFSNNYNDNLAYKQFLKSGTSSIDKVQGRLDYWNNLID